MASKLKTAILGATGYSGFELARILLRHPGVETPVMLQRSGESAAEANLADMYPAISGNGGYPLQPWSWSELKQRRNRAAISGDAARSIPGAGAGSVGPWYARGGSQRRLAVAAGAKPRRLWFS